MTASRRDAPTPNETATGRSDERASTVAEGPLFSDADGEAPPAVPKRRGLWERLGMLFQLHPRGPFGT